MNNRYVTATIVLAAISIGCALLWMALGSLGAPMTPPTRQGEISEGVSPEQAHIGAESSGRNLVEEPSHLRELASQELHGLTPGHLTIRLVNATGAPQEVQGVLASIIPRNASANAPAAEVCINGTGAEVAGLLAGDYTVRLMPTIAVAARVQIQAGKGSDVAVVVAGGVRRLRLQVTDEQAVPVPFAYVDAMSLAASHWPRQLGQTNSSGVLTIAYGKPDTMLGPRSRGYHAIGYRLPGPAEDMRLILRRGDCRVAGSVVDYRGKAVAEAQVRAGDIENKHKSVTLPDGSQANRAVGYITQTGVDGRFEVGGLPPGPINLHVRRPGYAAAQVEGHATEVGEFISIVLHPEAVCRGRVVDCFGVAVAECRIEAKDSPVINREDSVKSDEQGRFVLPGLPEGRLRLRAEHEERGMAEFECEVRAGVDFEWNVTLDAGAVFQGRVVDEEERPMAQLLVHTVVLDKEEKTTEWMRSVVSDEVGNVQVKGVPRGRLLRIIIRNGVQEHFALSGVDPDAGKHVLRVKRPLVKASHISMLITDESGAAIEGARVQYRRVGSGQPTVEGTCDPSGRFRSDLVEGGEYQVAVLAVGRLPHKAIVHVGDSGVFEMGTIVLARAGRICVVASALRNGQTFEIATMNGIRVARLTMDRGGYLVSEPLKPGRYAVIPRMGGAYGRMVCVDVCGGEDCMVELPDMGRENLEVRVHSEKVVEGEWCVSVWQGKVCVYVGRLAGVVPPSIGLACALGSGRYRVTLGASSDRADITEWVDLTGDKKVVVLRIR